MVSTLLIQCHLNMRTLSVLIFLCMLTNLLGLLNQLPDLCSIWLSVVLYFTSRFN